MVAIPDNVRALLSDKDAVKTLVTVSPSGRPHGIVA